MTVFEYYDFMANSCRDKAKKTSDVNLQKFYLNAALGFESKQKKLTVREAEWNLY